MKKCYSYTDIPIKVGHIVVIKNGTAGGNERDVITKVTKVDLSKRSRTFNESIVACESMRYDPFGKLAFNRHTPTKIPSYYERVDDLRLANSKERKLFFKRNLFGGVVYASLLDLPDEESDVDFEKIT